jgi:hypothetical protein
VSRAIVWDVLLSLLADEQVLAECTVPESSFNTPAWDLLLTANAFVLMECGLSDVSTNARLGGISSSG